MDETFLPWWVGVAGWGNEPQGAFERDHPERPYPLEEEIFTTLHTLILQDHDLAALASIGVPPPTGGSCEPNVGREYADILRMALHNAEACVRVVQSVGAPLRDNERECRRRADTYRQRLEAIDLSACSAAPRAD